MGEMISHIALEPFHYYHYSIDYIDMGLVNI